MLDSHLVWHAHEYNVDEHQTGGGVREPSGGGKCGEAAKGGALVQPSAESTRERHYDHVQQRQQVYTELAQAGVAQNRMIGHREGGGDGKGEGGCKGIDGGGKASEKGGAGGDESPRPIVIDGWLRRDGDGEEEEEEEREEDEEEQRACRARAPPAPLAP